MCRTPEFTRIFDAKLGTNDYPGRGNDALTHRKVENVNFSWIDGVNDP